MYFVVNINKYNYMKIIENDDTAEQCSSWSRISLQGLD